LKVNQELNAGLSSRGNFIMIGDMVYAVQFGGFKSWCCYNKQFSVRDVKAGVSSLKFLCS
jgi:hypothetical protein